MANVTFATLDAALPAELTDRIAQFAHKAQYDGVMEDIRTAGTGGLTSDFDQAIKEGAANIMDYIRAKHGDKVTVTVDDYIDWYTMAFVFPETSRFALYHHFAEWGTCYQYLIDGIFHNNTFHIERYLYVDRHGRYTTTCDEIAHFRPFEQITPSLHNVTFDVSQVGKKTWKFPKEVLIAFDKVEYSREE